MQLMLTGGSTGGEGSFHDWNYMLDHLGLLGSTKTIAGVIRFVGILTIIGASLTAFYFSFITPAETDSDL